MELLEVPQPFTGGGEHDRPAGDLGDGQRGAAAGVAVELGEHDAGEVDAGEEGLGGGDRVLADHRVDDEEHLVGVHGGADVRGLLHEHLVDAEAAGGVDDDDVVELRAGDVHRVRRDLDRIADAVAGLGCVGEGAGALADDLELVDGIGPLEVGGDEHRPVALGLEPVGELAGERRLARALESGEHDHGRRALGELQATGLPAEDPDELVVDDLDDLLAGVERLRHLRGQRPLADLPGERAHHRQRDVGVEQRTPDFPDRGVDVGFGEPALAAQVLEGRRQPIGEGVEHEVSQLSSREAEQFDLPGYQVPVHE